MQHALSFFCKKERQLNTGLCTTVLHYALCINLALSVPQVSLHDGMQNSAAHIDKRYSNILGHPVSHVHGQQPKLTTD